MSRSLVLGSFAAVAVAGGVAVAAAAPSAPDGERPARPLRALAGVNFVSVCRFSHRLPDDPIVAPGRPGASHDHSFVGARTTHAHSTAASLLAGPTTCRRPGDTAAYWMPTLLVDGVAVAPRGATIYYRRKTVVPVRPFPLGFRMIAGDALARAPQDLRVASWSCGPAAGIRPSADVPSCPDSRASGLRLRVHFPSCWDGQSLDGADHKSHMAYPIRGRCPESHPVAVPAISLIYRYPVGGGDGVTLASGGQYSAHADFLNAWQPAALAGLVERCLNALRHCGARGA